MDLELALKAGGFVLAVAVPFAAFAGGYAVLRWRVAQDALAREEHAKRVEARFDKFDASLGKVADEASVAVEVARSAQAQSGEAQRQATAALQHVDTLREQQTTTREDLARLEGRVEGELTNLRLRAMKATGRFQPPGGDAT